MANGSCQRPTDGPMLRHQFIVLFGGRDTTSMKMKRIRCKKMRLGDRVKDFFFLGRDKRHIGTDGRRKPFLSLFITFTHATSSFCPCRTVSSTSPWKSMNIYCSLFGAGCELSLVSLPRLFATPSIYDLYKYAEWILDTCLLPPPSPVTYILCPNYCLLSPHVSWHNNCSVDVVGSICRIHYDDEFTECRSVVTWPPQTSSPLQWWPQYTHLFVPSHPFKFSFLHIVYLRATSARNSCKYLAHSTKRTNDLG